MKGYSLNMDVLRFIFFLSPIFFSSILVAQNNDANNPEALKAKQLLQHSEKLASLKYSQQQKPSPEGIIKHLRGQGGIHFPDRAWDDSYDPLKGALAPAVEETMKEFDQKLQKIPEPDFPKFNACSSNKTEKERVDFDTDLPASSKRLPISDVLFLNSKDVPSEPGAIFGQYTLVIPLSGAKDDSLGGYAEQLKIPCVPYRIRNTLNYVFKDEGLNALRNFGEDYLGKGFYHQYIQEKYGVKEVKE